MAEGVRLYCQETWKLVTEMKGVQLVEKYITHVSHTMLHCCSFTSISKLCEIHALQVVEFYISQSEAANHAVREAACACIAELGTKV